MDLIEKINNSINNKDNFVTIEPHGESYAIYLGRKPFLHGLNVANLKEVDTLNIDTVLKQVNLIENLVKNLDYLNNCINNNIQPETKKIEDIQKILNQFNYD